MGTYKWFRRDNLLDCFRLAAPHPFLSLTARAARSSIVACHGGIVQQALLAIRMAARQSVGDCQGPGRTVSAERQDDRYEGRRRPGRERGRTPLPGLGMQDLEPLLPLRLLLSVASLLELLPGQRSVGVGGKSRWSCRPGRAARRVAERGRVDKRGRRGREEVGERGHGSCTR